MLVLTRKPQEEIVIGEGENKIIIKILRICGSRVRIGIEAKKDVNIRRSEIQETVSVKG